MAISTNTFTINAGYAQSDMILQLESSFAWLGWHDKCDHTGIVTGLTAMRGQYQQDPLLRYLLRQRFFLVRLARDPNLECCLCKL